MIKNSFNSALRYLYKNKLFSAVNFVGLLIGFIASFYLTSYIYHESTFDTDHPDVDNTYRLLSLQDNNGNGSTLSAINFLPIAGFISQDIPEVLQIARVRLERDRGGRISNFFINDLREFSGMNASIAY